MDVYRKSDKKAGQLVSGSSHKQAGLMILSGVLLASQNMSSDA